MTPLLELDHVSRRYGRGAHEEVVLADVSLELYPGELMAIWGRRGSGRSTLVALAAGVLSPSSGVVRFAGHDLATRRGQDLGGGIGFCRRTLRSTDQLAIKDQLMHAQLARGAAPKQARARAWRALQRVDAGACATARPADLDGAETVRVMLARALTLEPALLVMDEPIMGVDLLERNDILELLRSLADDGIAILTCNGETTAFAGCDRALSLSDGKLRGKLTPELAPVTALRPRRHTA